MRSKRLRMPLGVLAAILLAVAASLVGSAGASRTHGGNQHRGRDQLIPLYDNANAADWKQACSQSSGSGGGSWIIANAATAGGGPGSVALPAWASVIEDCYSYGRASVIGYVWTDYGRASVESVERQIDAWYSYYPGEIAGIFFDGAADATPGTGASNQSFYRTLSSYVHTREGDNNEVVLNFGENPGSDWMLSGSDTENADIVVTFEGSYDTPGGNPYTSWTQAAWELGYPAHDFAALIHDATAGEAAPQPSSACAALARQNIGYVYVGTAYDGLPSYFSDLSRESSAGGC